MWLETAAGDNMRQDKTRQDKTRQDKKPLNTAGLKEFHVAEERERERNG